jgi:hypothetical protein
VRFGPARALGHGVVTLQLAHLLSAEEALSSLGAATLNLVRSFDDDAAARRSLRRISRRVLA